MNAIASRWLIQEGSVADTTTDPTLIPIRVTAHPAEPIVGLPSNPLMLDGIIASAAYTLAAADGLDLPPMTRDQAVDIALPLATWTRPAPDGLDPRIYAATPGHVWGWAASAATYRPDRHTIAEVRRKPALEHMAYWSTAKNHNIALGARKAGNNIHQAVWTRQITWCALATSIDAVNTLLSTVTHLGRLTHHGWGRLLTPPTATVDPEAYTRWQHRPMPHPTGAPQGIRPPYHHPSRSTPCQTP